MWLTFLTALYCKVTSITVMPRSDFSVYSNTYAHTHARNSHAELAVKQLSGCHCKTNVVSKFNRIEPLDLHIWEVLDAPSETEDDRSHIPRKRPR